jgi:hypothetical protein
MSNCASTMQSLAATCGDSDSTVCETSGGSLASGTACGNALQCASAFCKGSGITESSTGAMTTITATCGVCTDKIAVGQACASSDRCIDGAACNQTPDPTGALSGVCAPTVKNDIGGACGSSTNQGINQCKAGLRCGMDQKCAALGASGSDCNSDDECTYPLVCALSGGDVVGTSCQTPKPAGAACVGNASASGCARELGCDPSSQLCVAVVRVAPGGGCDDFAHVCAQGGCNTPVGGTLTGTCPALLNEGDACDPSANDKTCGGSSVCINGKCTIFDPSSCK